MGSMVCGYTDDSTYLYEPLVAMSMRLSSVGAVIQLHKKKGF